MGMPQNTMPGRPQPPPAPTMQQGARPSLKYQNQMQQVEEAVAVLQAHQAEEAAAQERKQMLGKRLFPLIQRMHTKLAGKITGMLLEMDYSELLHLLESSEDLKAKVDGTVALIEAYEPFLAAQASAAANKPGMKKE